MIETNSTSTKVEGDIVHILYDEQKAELRRQGLWPAEFNESPSAAAAAAAAARPADDDSKAAEHESNNDDGDGGSDSDGSLEANPNRRVWDDDSGDDSEED